MFYNIHLFYVKLFKRTIFAIEYSYYNLIYFCIFIKPIVNHKK